MVRMSDNLAYYRMPLIFIVNSTYLSQDVHRLVYTSR